MNKTLLTTIIIMVLIPCWAFACLWDRDTLSAESDGRMNVVNVILGRFDRFPDAYYLARLERLKSELKAEPHRLDLWDDTAVALDRLGLSNEAITAMATKRHLLDALPSDHPDRQEHEYRYLANLGTFYAHRWVSSGADRQDMADLEEAKRLIAEAIELNPDAHFGRERYQLFAIEWLLETETNSRPIMIVLPGEVATELERVRQTAETGMLDRLGIRDASEGLTGLIVLGAGAESIDLMSTLERVLAAEGRSYVAQLALYRTMELLEDGKRSLDPAVQELTDSDLLGVMRRRYLPVEDDEGLRVWYEKARIAATTRQAERMRYLQDMLDRGEHPDTHPAIWAEAAKGPPLPPMNVGGQPANTLPIGTIGLANLLLVAALILWIREAFRKRRSRTKLR